MKALFFLTWFRNSGKDRGLIHRKEVEVDHVGDILDAFVDDLPKGAVDTGEIKIYKLVYHEKDGKILEDHHGLGSFKLSLISITLKT